MSSSQYREILRSQENVHDGTPSSSMVAAGPVVPPPPKQARTAFMCFTDAKKDEILRNNDIKENEADILRLVSEQWRLLTARERAFWDEEARNDKVRYVREKSEYKGEIPMPKRRAKKHPMAPKRPMSAFLKYSQLRRKAVKEQNPDMSNTDVSRLLGEMWRNAPAKEKQPYQDQELVERAEYKVKIEEFRQNQAKLDANSRTSHKSIAARKSPPPLEEDKGPIFEGIFAANSFEPLKRGGDRLFRPVSMDSRDAESRYGFAPPQHGLYTFRTSDNNCFRQRGPPQPQHYKPYANKSDEGGGERPVPVDYVRSASAPNHHRPRYHHQQHHHQRSSSMTAPPRDMFPIDLEHDEELQQQSEHHCGGRGSRAGGNNKKYFAEGGSSQQQQQQHPFEFYQPYH